MYEVLEELNRVTEYLELEEDRFNILLYMIRLLEGQGYHYLLPKDEHKIYSELQNTLIETFEV